MYDAVGLPMPEYSAQRAAMTPHRPTVYKATWVLVILTLRRPPWMIMCTRHVFTIIANIKNA